MTAQGFDYTPVTSQTGVGYQFGDKEGHHPDDPEWVAQYGYGVVDAPWIDDDAWGSADPNEAYVATLSVSEAAAYQDTLWGPLEEYDPEAVFVPAGCSGEAQRELDRDDPLASDEFAPLLGAVMEFYTERMTAPEMAPVEAEWAACMADAGHPDFTIQFDALATFAAEVTVLHQEQPELTREDPAYLDIRDREIAMALADLDCRVEIDFSAQQREVFVALEEQFIEDNRAELEAYRAAAETVGLR